MSLIDEKKKERIIRYLKYLPLVLLGVFIIILIASSIISDVHNMSYWEAFKGGFTSLGTWGFWSAMFFGGLTIYSVVYSIPRMWRNFKKNRERRQY